MKCLIVLGIFVSMLTATSAWAQPWRDSLNHARSLYQKGNYKEALKYYKSADRLAPNDVDLSEEKGQSAYRAGDYKAAEEAFHTAASRQTDQKRKSSAYNNLGNARMKQKDYGGAEEAFKESLRLNPSNEKARQRLAEVKRLKKEQEEKEKEQQQKGEDNQEQNEGGDQPKDDQKKPSDGQGQQKKNSSSQKPGESNKSESQQKQQQQKGSSSNGQKLADKQTERKLDELMRQEMDAKKRLDGSKGKSNGAKAKKDW